MTTPTTAQPRERITELNKLLAKASKDTDLFGLRGELGLAWLERYENEGTEVALRTGLEWLNGVVAQAPDHPHHDRWQLARGMAYSERGRRRRRIADYHTATGLLTALAVATADDHIRAQALAELGEVAWTRYWLVRFGPKFDRDRALTEVDTLLTRVGPRLTTGDVTHLGSVRLVAGLARLERYELTSDPTELDRGIGLLTAASIDALPPSDRRRCQAAAELVDALHQRSYFDGTGSLDRALSVAQRTMAACGPADGVAWLLLHRYTASAAYRRWEAGGTWRHLRLAMRCWRPLLPVEELDRHSRREYERLTRDAAAQRALGHHHWVTRCNRSPRA